MTSVSPYKDFTNRLKLLISKHPAIVTTTLSNIFTMRLIGNKTHGDLAEIAIAEFINQSMYDFRSLHVGKDLYRAKTREEDITIINEITRTEFPVSLKAYGDGPLQLSTDKAFAMFPRLEREGTEVLGRDAIRHVLDDPAFVDVQNINVLPLIYDEERRRCNILVFNHELAMDSTSRIEKVSQGHGRKHPIYRFLDNHQDYVCEVRYGGATANALQRGLWTHTKNGRKYFDSITDGWIDYSQNTVLVKLFSHALVASRTGHEAALDALREDIAQVKRSERI